MIAGCICDNSLWSWDAIGALGQWAGALAAAGAVWWGVHITRDSKVTKAKCYMSYAPSESGPILRFYAVNKGNILINFCFFGLHLKGSSQSILSKYFGSPPKEVALPGESRDFYLLYSSFNEICQASNITGTNEFEYQFRDITGKVYKGKSFKFDLDKMVLIDKYSKK